MAQQLPPAYQRSSGLVDVLDRVLDKGLVVAGDIKVALAEVELLTIRIRLIVCSIDKAEEIGLDWWKHDRYFGGGSAAVDEGELRRQIRDLEEKVALLEAGSSSAPARTGSKRSRTKERKVAR